MSRWTANVMIRGSRGVLLGATLLVGAACCDVELVATAPADAGDGVVVIVSDRSFAPDSTWCPMGSDLARDESGAPLPPVWRVLSAWRNGRWWRMHVWGDRAPGGLITGRRTTDPTRFASSSNPRLLFIHGFGKGFADVIDGCVDLETKFSVEVIGFDWPGLGSLMPAKLYHEGRTAAVASAPGLNALLEELARRGRRDSPPFSLLVHSMGNATLAACVRAMDPLSLPRGQFLFDNVVLNAPDVDCRGHEEWIGLIRAKGVGRRVFVVINENDVYLRFAERFALFAIDQSPRLGNTLPPRLAPDVAYVDLTATPGVGAKHRHFHTTHGIEAVNAFFRTVLRGDDPARGTGEFLPGRVTRVR